MIFQRNTRYITFFFGFGTPVLLLSGCTSIADFATLNDTSSKTERRESMTNVLKHMQEWEELRPGLIRLVKKENELSFLLSELESISNIQTFDNDFVDANGNPLSVPLDGFKNSLEIQNMTSAVKPNTAEGSSVEVASAIPIQSNLAAKSKFLSSAEANNQSAPQYASASNPTKAQLRSQITKFNVAIPPQDAEISRQTAALAPSKFQDENVSDIVGKINDCSTLTNNSGDKAIHLVSYKVKNHVEKGWRELLLKHNDVLCGKRPIVASVTVNGTDYKSLRAGPYVDVSQAQNACKKLRKSGQYCAVTEFSGMTIEQL